jgi:hypothetical protein
VIGSTSPQAPRTVLSAVPEGRLPYLQLSSQFMADAAASSWLLMGSLLSATLCYFIFAFLQMDNERARMTWWRWNKWVFLLQWVRASHTLSPSQRHRTTRGAAASPDLHACCFPLAALNTRNCARPTVLQPQRRQRPLPTTVGMPLRPFGAHPAQETQRQAHRPLG